MTLVRSLHENAYYLQSIYMNFTASAMNNTLTENDVLFQKVTQAYSEKNPSAPIRSRT